MSDTSSKYYTLVMSNWVGEDIKNLARGFSKVQMDTDDASAKIQSMTNQMETLETENTALKNAVNLLTNKITELSEIIDNLPSGGGGAPKAPWVLVAAADAPADVKAYADFVCDGTQDWVEIMAAINKCATNSNYSMVQFSKGTFNLDMVPGPVLARIVVNNPNISVIRGMGMDETILIIEQAGGMEGYGQIELHNSNDFTLTVSHMQFVRRWTESVQVLGDNIVIENCKFRRSSNSRVNHVVIRGSNNTVRNCVLYDAATCIKVQGNNNRVSDNTIELRNPSGSAEYLIDVSSGMYHTVERNRIQCGYGASGAGIYGIYNSTDRAVIWGNYCWISAPNNGCYGIQNNGNDCVIANNDVTRMKADNPSTGYSNYGSNVQTLGGNAQ